MNQQYDWKLGIALLIATFLLGCKPNDTATQLSDSQAAVQKMCFANGSPGTEQRKLINQAAEELKAIDEDVLRTLLTHLEDLPADKSFGDWERPIIEALSRRHDPRVQCFLAKCLDSGMVTPADLTNPFSACPCAEAIDKLGPAGLCMVLDYIRSTDIELSPVYIQHASIIVYGSYNMDSERSTNPVFSRDATELYLKQYLADVKVVSNRTRLLDEYASFWE